MSKNAKFGIYLMHCVQFYMNLLCKFCFHSIKFTYFKPNSFIAFVSQLIASDWFLGFFCSKAMVMTYIQVTKCITSQITAHCVGTKYHYGISSFKMICIFGVYFCNFPYYKKFSTCNSCIKCNNSFV